MIKAKPLVVNYWVVFSWHTRVKHWVFKWLHPHFRHVYAIKLSEGGHFWIKVEATHAHVEVDQYPVALYPEISNFCAEGDIIIPVTAVIEDRVRGGLSIFTCVEIVKALLGIKAPLLITPYQLYKRITRGQSNK